MVRPAPLVSTSAGTSNATSFERHCLAVAATLALHLVLLAFSAAVQAIVNSLTAPHRNLLIVTMIALVAAYCSLGAIWWSRSSWPAHWKTFLAILVCADLWMLLVSHLDVVKREPIAAAGWGVALCLQVALTALAAVLIESRSP